MISKSKNGIKILRTIQNIKNSPKIYDIHWEPLGKDFEMVGRSGGWFVNKQSIGLNINEAINFIEKFGINW